MQPDRSVTDHADAILAEGFRDGYYVLPMIGELFGIFVSDDWPLDENEGADGDVVIEMDVAAKLNVHLGTTRRLTQEEEADLTVCRFEPFRHGKGTDLA